MASNNNCVFSIVCIRYKGKQYEYLHKISLSDYIMSLIIKNSKKIMYFTTSDDYVCYIMEMFTDKPNIKKIIFVGDYDTDSDVDSNDSDDYIDDDGYSYNVDIKKKLNEIASSCISVRLIKPDHWDCVGNKICGCGCDKLHDGGADLCEPYPRGSKHF